MKRRLMTYFTIVLLLVSMVSGMVLPAGAATVTYARNMTDKSAAGTYYVADAADLARIAVLVNAGMSMKGYTFLQTKDIDLSGVTYTPIGAYNTSLTAVFRGTYDGQRHVIKNFVYYDAERNGAGIFGHLYGATVKNLGIESGSVTAANRAGGIAGYADGSNIINCYNKASITILSGADGVGGIAGVARSSSDFYGCYNAGTVTSVTSGAGGIVGWAGKGDNSMLVGCYNAGQLKHTGEMVSSYGVDVIARNTNRTAGDFSSCYYLAGCYKDAEGKDVSETYNGHKAIRLETEDALAMAYVLNHATGANTNAFTVKSGKIAFSSADTDGVTDLRIKAYVDGVLVKDTGVVRQNAGGYTVPDTYESYSVLSAASDGEKYGNGNFIPSETAGILTVELELEGDFPSVSDYASNQNASVFTVSTAKELADLAALVDAGNSFAGKSVYVTADLDFSDYSTWNGIGECKGTGGGVVADGALPFSGTFDGQFHHFKNINFKNATRYTAIFSLAQNAVLRNIIFDEGTIYLDGDLGRSSGVLAGALSNTAVLNMENHVSIYTNQQRYGSDNIGFVGMATDSTIIKSVVNYGEVGYAGKETVQQNGSFVGWGYGKTKVIGCIAVGEVFGEESDPIARGCTIIDSYSLPNGGNAGTMTFETLLSGEAAHILNKATEQQVWSKGAEGPALNPDHPVKKAVYNLADTEALISESRTAYYNAGEAISLPVMDGYKTLNEAQEFWPLANTYTGFWSDHSINVFYSRTNYKVRYVTNGGTLLVDPTAQVTSVATALPKDTEIQREGYAFTGWYDNPELSGKPVTETPTDVYHEISYYASWKPLTEITTAAQLAAMKADGAYILKADINLSGVNFAPIGTYENPFTGHFDGDGHVISGLNINSTENYQGLFGVNEGVIRNVILDDDCTIKGNAYVGGVAGENLGVIENCISRAKVAGASSQKTIDFTLLVQNMRVASPIPQVRQDAMKERMDTCDADLMLLQEANSPWITFLETNYANSGKYGLLYKYRAANSKEAVPVMYKKSKFDLIESGHFWLSDTPNVESAPEGYSHYRICTWAVLRDKTTSKYVIAFSVHLDTGGNEVRKVNAAAMKKRFDEVRSKYASYDPVCIIAGDFNCPVDSDPYNILVSDDMVNTIYEITPSLTPARIDHILISENNVRASDQSFEYLPVIDAALEIPSDHQGLYVRMLGLVKSRIGGIAGSNSGIIKNSIGAGTVGGSYNYGTLTGRNMATVENAYYVEQSGINPLGNSIETTAPAAITSNYETVTALNKALSTERFTVKSGEIALTAAGEEIACMTSSATNASHRFNTAKVVAPTCTEDGYTYKTCSVCGYVKKYNYKLAFGHTFGELKPYNENYHLQTCVTCESRNVYADHVYTAETLEATCESLGVIRYTCDCGYSYDEIIDDKLSHIWTDAKQQTADQHQLTCARDNTHLLEKAHILSTSVVESTCEELGGTAYDCVDCGYHNFVESGEPAGHLYGTWQPYDGESHQAICQRDASHVTYAPHQGEAVSTTAPTCEEKGYTTYLCGDCGATYNADFVDALGHSFQYDAELKQYICHCGGVYVTTGDLDGDGVATTADVVLLLRRIDGWQGEIQDYAADVNCDGRIAVYDAVRFLQILNS